MNPCITASEYATRPNAELNRPMLFREITAAGYKINKNHMNTICRKHTICKRHCALASCLIFYTDCDLKPHHQLPLYFRNHEPKLTSFSRTIHTETQHFVKSFTVTSHSFICIPAPGSVWKERTPLPSQRRCSFSSGDGGDGGSSSSSSISRRVRVRNCQRFNLTD
jgi:hypothetical protein